MKARKIWLSITQLSSREILSFFYEDERVVVLQFDFKTAKTAGPTKIDLSDDRDLVHYLKLFLKIRSSLLGGHDFFFCNRHGGPFDSSGSFANI